MEIFLPTSEHTLTVIPRYNSPTVSLRIRNEQDEATILNLTTSYTAGYLSMDFTYTFAEDQNYDLEVKDGNGTLLWRGMAYCTSQDPQEYKLNADIIEL